MLDVAVGREDQRLGGHTPRQLTDVLGEQQMQPGQPVGSGDRDDAAVGEVHETGTVRQRALFSEQVPVVGGDTFVPAFGGDGTGQ